MQNMSIRHVNYTLLKIGKNLGVCFSREELAFWGQVVIDENPILMDDSNSQIIEFLFKLDARNTFLSVKVCYVPETSKMSKNPLKCNE